MVLRVLRKLRRAEIGRSAPNPRSSSLASSSVSGEGPNPIPPPYPKLVFVDPKLVFEQTLTGGFGHTLTGGPPRSYPIPPYPNLGFACPSAIFVQKQVVI